MIERNYSRYVGDHSDALARGALLDVTLVPPADNVVPITTTELSFRASSRIAADRGVTAAKVGVTTKAAN
jgi:hypothetical protein